MTADVLADDVCLRDGFDVSFRPVCVDDEAAILEFLTHLSAESRRRASSPARSISGRRPTGR